jgi:very-short-patch-repair endonuclease
MRGEQPWLTNRSRVLRANTTRAEATLWSRLRGRQINDCKFTRQTPVEGFFADFLCRERRLIVEVDGATHGTPEEIAADAVRTAVLEAAGYRLVRVWNSDVTGNIDGVLEMIFFALQEGKNEGEN